MTHPKLRAEHSSRFGLAPKIERKTTLYQSWWVLLFIAGCSVVYFHSIGKKNQVIDSLDQHISALEAEKKLLSQENEDLCLQINSQSDPAWIQLVLMKELGLVPEGQLKVYFHSDND